MFSEQSHVETNGVFTQDYSNKYSDTGLVSHTCLAISTLAKNFEKFKTLGTNLL